jgi:hypothetical protein
MTKWMLAAGAAAMALAVPSMAQKGGDKGGPKGGGAAKVERGGGGHNDVRRGGGGPKAVDQRQQVERGGGKRAERQQGRADKIDARPIRAEKAERREARADKRDLKAAARGSRDVRVERDDRRNDARIFTDDRRLARGDLAPYRGQVDGCPPGLAKKGNGCLPPGQAKKLIGAALPASLAAAALSGPFSQWYRDDERYFYRNDGDYIYQVDRQGGLVNALFPFQDRDYSYYPIGMTYPTEYDSYNVPYQYRSFYPDGADYSYRYGDGAIYQVNRSNSSIESIVALLAGDLGVGQAMPADYGVYNVPMAYRDRYYDSPDAMYRYNDGYIYQADPKTQLITAVIDALA